MRIGLDLHGVVFNSLEMKRIALEKVTGLHIPGAAFNGRTSISQWYSRQVGIGGRALEEADWDGTMKYLHETDAYIEYAQPMPGAVEAIRRLSDAGHEIGIVTATKGLDEGKVWAALARFDLPISFVHATKRKPKVPHYESCNVAIDDDPDHLECLNAVRRRIVAILLLPRHEPERRPWMETPQHLSGHIRVARGWDEAMPHLLPLAA